MRKSVECPKCGTLAARLIADVIFLNKTTKETDDVK